MLFIDYEVFRYNWLCVILDTNAKEKKVIVDDVEELRKYYLLHKNDIWVGYNIRHYDQYIMKAILAGFDPWEMNYWIIVQNNEGWAFSKALRKIKLNIYDVMPNPPVGLKTLEGFMGSNIKESDVNFLLDRPLTQEEIEDTIKYCTHDVEQTAEVFLRKVDDFNAMLDIQQKFDLPLSAIGMTEARITATVLGCEQTNFNDEFDYFFLPCLQLKKYACVKDWFEQRREEVKKALQRGGDPYWIKKNFYNQCFEIVVAGVPHTFAFGGLHGAPNKPVHKKGLILHVDVNNYYPSLLIAWGLVTRAATNDNYTLVYDTRKALKMQQLAAKTKEEAKTFKKAQLPYKKMLNALSGAMKDPTNPAYDPRNNNIMCINGQLMLLDLIEHLEVVPGFELIQSNTDGLIIYIPDTDEAFNMVDDICYEWEQRCSTAKCEIALALDTISEIYQRDVNNYLWIEPDGNVGERKGCLKELSDLDNDLPIINKAVVDYMVQGIPVERTVFDCNELIQFQKIVKLSDKYEHVEHEHCIPRTVMTGVRKKKQFLTYDNTVRYTYKSYRVFASNDARDGRILKCRQGKKDKFGNTPEHCFIENGNIQGISIPKQLDKDYYVKLAQKRLREFGINDY